MRTLALRGGAGIAGDDGHHLAAALARAVGVDFQSPMAARLSRLPGFAVVTGFFSVVGIVIAAALFC